MPFTINQLSECVEAEKTPNEIELRYGNPSSFALTGSQENLQINSVNCKKRL